MITYMETDDTIGYFRHAELSEQIDEKNPRLTRMLSLRDAVPLPSAV